MLVVRPTRGATPGVAIAWTVLTDRGEALYAVVVGDDGVPRGKAVELARTSDDVVWVDIVASDVGSVVVWAEETRGGDANVLAASLDVDGKVRGVPARIARGVAGWHALQLPNGVGVSTIVTPKGAKGGSLSFQRLDADGHPSGAARADRDGPRRQRRRRGRARRRPARLRVDRPNDRRPLGRRRPRSVTTARSSRRTRRSRPVVARRFSASPQGRPGPR